MSPARKATAFAVPAALIAAAITFWVISSNLSGIKAADTGPVTSVTVTEVEGTTERCAFIIDGLPEKIDDRDQRAVKGHPGSLAYGDPPIVLVCGVARPAGLDGAPQLNSVNGVTWLIEENVDTSAYGLPGKNTLWTSVDREVYVAVAVPNEIAGSVAMSPISKVIGDRFPSVEAPATPGG